MENYDELRTLRHTASHIMAQAVKRLFPDVRLAIGPATDNGFYYDFDTERTFTAEDLEKIEAEMKKIVKENLPIKRFELPRDEALALVREMGEPYKEELINDLPEDAVLERLMELDGLDFLVKGAESLGAAKCARSAFVIAAVRALALYLDPDNAAMFEERGTGDGDLGTEDKGLDT